MPAVSATLSRSMNWSNGAGGQQPAAPRRGRWSARADAGSAQYGPRSHSPRLCKPKKPWVYQKKPRVVVTHDRGHRDQQPVAQFGEVVDQRHGAVGIGPGATSARVELLEDSGGVHGQCLNVDAGRRALATRHHAAVGTDLAGVRPVACRRTARARGVSHALRGDRRGRQRGGVGLSATVGLHLLDLGLEDPHRLAQRTRRVRELLGTEQQHEHRDDDQPVPGL